MAIQKKHEHSFEFINFTLVNVNGGKYNAANILCRKCGLVKEAIIDQSEWAEAVGSVGKS